MVQDHHLTALPTAEHLCSLNLSHCESLTANSLMFLKEMSSLTFLDLSYCRCDPHACLTRTPEAMHSAALHRYA